MITFNSTEWVSEHLGDPQVLIVDPRTRMKHLAGHLAGSVSFPMSNLFDESGGLRAPHDLAERLGGAGVDSSRTLVLYDSHDGQKASMMAWALTYLGHEDVHVMSVYYDRWLEEGRNVLYRQAPVRPVTFEYSVQPPLRATAADVLSNDGWSRLDVRSDEEFKGTVKFDENPGRLPGAVHVDWREFAGEDGNVLASESTVASRLASGGIGPDEPVVAYCASGSRASLAWLALSRTPRTVRLYDGSFRDWTARALPTELG